MDAIGLLENLIKACAAIEDRRRLIKDNRQGALRLIERVKRIKNTCEQLHTSDAMHTAHMHSHLVACDELMKKIAAFIDKYNSRSGFKRLRLADKDKRYIQVQDFFQEIDRVIQDMTLGVVTQAVTASPQQDDAPLDEAVIETDEDIVDPPGIIDGCMSDHMKKDLCDWAKHILFEKPQRNIIAVGDHLLKDDDRYCEPEDKIWSTYSVSQFTWQQAIVRYALEMYKEDIRRLDPREIEEDSGQVLIRPMVMLMQAELLTHTDRELTDFDKFCNNHDFVDSLRKESAHEWIERWGDVLLQYYPASMLYDSGSWEITQDVTHLYDWFTPAMVQYMTRIWPQWQSMYIFKDDVRWIFERQALIKDPLLKNRVSLELKKMIQCADKWLEVESRADHPIAKNQFAQAVLHKALGLWTQDALPMPICDQDCQIMGDQLKLMSHYIKHDQELIYLPKILQTTLGYLMTLRKWDPLVGKVFPRLMKTLSVLMPKLVMCLGDEGRTAESFKDYVLEEQGPKNRQLIAKNIKSLKKAYQQAVSVEEERRDAQVRMECDLVKGWLMALPMNQAHWYELLKPLGGIKGLSLSHMAPMAILQIIITLGKITHQAVKLFADSHVLTHAQLDFLHMQIKKSGHCAQEQLAEVMALDQDEHPSYCHAAYSQILVSLLKNHQNLEAQIVWGIEPQDKGLMYLAVQLFDTKYNDAAAIAIAALHKLDLSQEIHQNKLTALREHDLALSQRALLLMPSLHKSTRDQSTLAQELQHQMRDLLWGELETQGWNEVRIRLAQWSILSKQGMAAEVPDVTDWDQWSLMQMTRALTKDQDTLLEAMGLKLLISGVDNPKTIVKMLLSANQEDVWCINHRLIYQNYSSEVWRQLWCYDADIAMKEAFYIALYPEALNSQINDQKLRSITDNATDKLWVLIRESDHDRGQRMYQLVYNDVSVKLASLLQEERSDVELITSWQRGFIKNQHVQQIYKAGEFQREYLSAGHVRSLGSFHIKLDPRMMGGELVSRGLEKAMYNKEDTWMLGTWRYKNQEPQPLWLTATVPGQTLVRPFEAKDIDLVSYAQAVILSVLLRSEDIKMDNVILSADGQLHIIDNESIACEPIRKKRFMEDQISKSEDVIVMKNCLLCMGLIEETVPEKIVDWLIDIQVDQVIEYWLLYLNQYDYMVRKDIPESVITRSHEIFTKSLKSSGLFGRDKEMAGGILRPEMPLSLISRVELGLKHMQSKVMEDRFCTIEDLIELAEPSITLVYRQIRADHGTDLDKAFTAIENGQYNRQMVDTAQGRVMCRASVATAMQYASALGQIADKEEERVLAVKAIDGCLELRQWQRFKEQYYQNPSQVKMGDFTKWYLNPVTNPQVMDMMSQIVGYQKTSEEQLTRMSRWSRLLSKSSMSSQVRSVTLRAMRLPIKELTTHVLKPLKMLSILVIDRCQWEGVPKWTDFLTKLSGYDKLNVLKVISPQWSDLRAVEIPRKISSKLMVRSVTLSGIDIDTTLFNMTWPALKTVRLNQFSGKYLIEERSRSSTSARKDVCDRGGVRYVYHKAPDQHLIVTEPIQVEGFDTDMAAAEYALWSLDMPLRWLLIDAMGDEVSEFYKNEVYRGFYDIEPLLESWSQVVESTGEDRKDYLIKYQKEQKKIPMHIVCSVAQMSHGRKRDQFCKSWREHMEQGQVGIIESGTVKYKAIDQLMMTTPPSQGDEWKACYEKALAEALLYEVMCGEQDRAEKIIQKYPNTLMYRAYGKEFHNGREFKSITPFQYALWALDWYMWDMMMKHIDQSHARSQLEELERQGTEHGKQFDGFDKLINAYQVYRDKYNGWNYDQRGQHWCTNVGGAQKALPIHALQEYYRKDRSMEPTPEFKEKRGNDHGDLRTDLSKPEGLGRQWGPAAWHPRPDSEALRHIIPVRATRDAKGVVSLKNTRNTQYTELRETLSKVPVLRIQ